MLKTCLRLHHALALEVGKKKTRINKDMSYSPFQMVICIAWKQSFEQANSWCKYDRMRSTWSCYWLNQFLTLALNILILSIFYISMDLSTNYFAHFGGCWASFVCSCHSILECCVTFSGVKLSIRSFVLFRYLLIQWS